MTTNGTTSRTSLGTWSRQAVEELSRERGEPEWLWKWRLEHWEAAQRLPMPGSRYTQVRGLPLEELPLASESSGSTGRTADDPTEGAGGVYSLYSLRDGGSRDGGSPYVRLSEELAQKGVLLLDVEEAVREHPERVREVLAAWEAPPDRITALQRAFFRHGLFAVIPRGVSLEKPLRVVQEVTPWGQAAFALNVLIAEPGSAVTLLEELSSPEGLSDSETTLHAESLYVRVGRGAEVRVAGVEDLSGRVYHFARRRAVVESDGKLYWTLGWLGGRLVMSHVETVLDGPGAEVEDVQVFFTDGRQHFDLTSNLLHQKPHTRGEVNVKGALKGKSKSVFWGLIRIAPGAQGANAFQAERSLILEDGPRSNAIPSLEIEANDVRCTHAAATSQLDEEQIFYLKSRGLTEDEAKKTIVEGFFEPTLEKIPLKSVRERMRELLHRKWQGTAGAKAA